MHQVLASLALAADQAVPSYWDRLLDTVAIDPGEFVAGAVSTAGALLGVLASLRRRSQTATTRDQTEPSKRRRKFWRVEPSLRLPRQDVTDWVRATGRVPLDHVHEGSLFSKFVSRVDGLVMRPSSVKPAFAIRQWREVSAGRLVAGSGAPHHGGFRVRVWLHPGEHERHLRKSMRAPGFRQTRSLAFCSPDQLGNPSARVQCRVVATPKKRMEFGSDGDGPFIEMESADPLLSDFGHRRMFRRDEVPPNTIWMVALYTAKGTKPKPAPDRDPRPPAGRRYVRLLIWPRWFALPSLAVASYPMLLLAMLVYYEQDAGLVGSITSVALIILGIQGFVILAVILSFAISHVLTRCIEQFCWGSNWTAGTTGCVEDARRLRNGQPPNPDKQGADDSPP